MLLMFLVGLLPLLIAPGLFFHYDTTPKTLVLLLAAASILLRPKNLFTGIEALQSRLSGRGFMWLAAGQVVVFAIATAVSARPWFGLLGSSWRQFGITSLLALTITILAVACELCVRPSRAVLLLRILTCVGMLLAIYCTFQFFDIDPLQETSVYHDHAGDSVIVRPPGTMGHADYFGWWLAVSTFCAVAAGKAHVSGWRHVAYASAVSQAFAVVLTGTRAAMVALLVGTVFVGVRAGRRTAVTGLMAVALLAGFVLSPAGTRLRARIQWSMEEPLGGARPLLWRDSLRMAATRPVTGFGPETYSAAFLPYQSQELARIYPDMHQESPHNLALDGFTSAGLGGLAIPVGWVVLAIFASRRAGFRGPLPAALAASMTAACFTSMMLAPILISLLVVAMMVARQEPGPSRPGGIRLPGYQVMLPVFAVALAALAIGTALTDFHLARFKQAPGVTAYLRYKSLRLPGSAQDLYCSRVLLSGCGQVADSTRRLECSQTSRDAAALATETADDPSNAWYNLAIFTASLNDIGGTTHALRQASLLAPNWFKPYWTQARVLQLQGQNAAALREARTAASLAGSRYPEVAKTLAELNQ